RLDFEDERIDGFLAGILHRRLHGHDGAGAQVDGNLVDGEVALDGGGSGEVLAGGLLDPFTLRNPDALLREVRIFIDGFGDGGDDHLLAEDVLVFIGVGFVGFRPVVVERAQEGYAGVVCAAAFGVDIRLHGVALGEGGAHDARVWLGVGPDAALGVGVLGGVRAQNWTVDAELNPARVELGLDGTGHVATDI